MPNQIEAPKEKAAEISCYALNLGWGAIKMAGIGVIIAADIGSNIYESAHDSRIVRRVTDGVNSILNHDLGNKRIEDVPEISSNTKPKRISRRDKVTFAPRIGSN